MTTYKSSYAEDSGSNIAPGSKASRLKSGPVFLALRQCRGQRALFGAQMALEGALWGSAFG